MRFQPTPAQRRLADAAELNPECGSVAELCALAECDPSSYYKWCHDIRFRQWFTRIWTTSVILDGWHIINLARGRAASSTAHFRALYTLLFETKGQAALQGWRELATASDPGSVEDDFLSDEPLTPKNSINPSLAVRPLTRAVAEAKTQSPSSNPPTSKSPASAAAAEAIPNPAQVAALAAHGKRFTPDELAAILAATGVTYAYPDPAGPLTRILPHDEQLQHDRLHRARGVSTVTHLDPKACTCLFHHQA
ncbi:MAG TPA: hypothetical protein VN709_05595 [Terriglobales bacterium]|nr:hypothetical protein [Terriglobales bacterium]